MKKFLEMLEYWVFVFGWFLALCILFGSVVMCSGCNKNTNYTTASPYLKYEVDPVEGVWTTTLHYKTNKSLVIINKIEKGLKKMGYENCIPGIGLNWGKDDKVEGRKIKKRIWYSGEVNKNSNIITIHFYFFALIGRPRLSPISDIADLSDQVYLDMMKDFDETVVRIRD